MHSIAVMMVFAIPLTSSDLSLNNIGHTSMADLTSLLSNRAVAARISLWAKKEFENPGLSHKDRIAQGILGAAIDRGELDRVTPDGSTVKRTVVAASSGNTGNSIAWVAKQKGYEVTIITNRKCSTEKQNDIKSKGAQLLIAEDIYDLTRINDPSAPHGVRSITEEELQNLPYSARIEAMKCTITEDVAKILGWYSPEETYPMFTKDYMKIETIMGLDENYFSVNQYNNLDNYKAHYDTLGTEIYSSTDGGKVITDFVFTGSTGGTITGVGTYLKEQDPNIKVVLADPYGSRLRQFLENGRPERDVGVRYSKTKIEGAGKDETTDIFEKKKKYVRSYENGSTATEWVIEAQAMVVADELSVLMIHRLRLQLGYWVGSSSGVNVQGAVDYADKLVAMGLTDRKIVTILCDPGFKYESKFFNDTWLELNRLPLYSTSVRIMSTNTQEACKA